MNARIVFSFPLSAVLLLLVLSKPSYCKEPSATHSVRVTISDLATDPQKYDGKLLCVNALAVNGWEGDNFLIDPSKPVPLEFPTREDPASVWYYSKQLYSMLTNQPLRANEAAETKTSDCHDVEGYFHFVEKPQMMVVFSPGHLQFECLEDCTIADPQPHSLASATHSLDIDETQRILRSHPDLKDKYKNLLLFLAVHAGRDDFAQELLAAGADTKFTGRGLDTSLMVATWECKIDVAKTLLSHGAPVNAANINGETALMDASHTCPDGQMVKLLLEAGANPNAKSKTTFTALMYASGNPLNVEELLKAGADPAIKNDYGNTAESDNCDRGEAGHAQACSLIREALKQSAGHSQDH